MKDFSRSLDLLRKAYQLDPKPIYSFRMAQHYDYHENDKKLAMIYYKSYLELLFNSNDSTETVPAGQVDLVQTAKRRITILKEDLFFEEN